MKRMLFLFLQGGGTTKDSLVDFCEINKLENVRFIPYQEKRNLIYSLNSADTHLVVNAKGIKGISVPSKVYGCLATNVPIFGILERGSEAWNIIEESNCGILSETGNYKEIEKNLRKVINEKHNFVKKHETGRKYLEEHLTMDKSIEKYRKEIEKILQN